jgi:hypothetical protein
VIERRHVGRRGVPGIGIVGRGAHRPRFGLIHQRLAAIRGDIGTLSRRARAPAMDIDAGLL